MEIHIPTFLSAIMLPFTRHELLGPEDESTALLHHQSILCNTPDEWNICEVYNVCMELSRCGGLMYPLNTAGQHKNYPACRSMHTLHNNYNKLFQPYLVTLIF
jgi:hypothetical protein